MGNNNTLLYLGIAAVAGFAAWKMGLLDSILGKKQQQGTPVSQDQWNKFVAANIADRKRGIPDSQIHNEYLLPSK